MATMISKTTRIESSFLMAWCWIAILCFGCGELPSKVVNNMLTDRSFHQKFGWKAEDFFDDPKVIALCRAIEENDLKMIDRLIQEGANVNACGKGNMTPLMWAFPDDKLERFSKLLDSGANPNVKFTSNLGVPSAFAIGNSVTTQAAKSRFRGYFAAVMAHGGDANITDGFGMPLIHIVILAMLPDAKERCQIVLEAGGDIDVAFDGGTPAMQAIATAGQYDLALYLYNQGADPMAYREDELQQAIHMIVRRESEIERLKQSDQKAFQELRQYLVEHGADAKAAREDLQRWATFSRIPSVYAQQWKKEVAARRAKENANIDRY